MTHLALFLSAFATVFLLGVQQQNVHGRHYLAAVVTSLGIGAAQIFLWRLVPEADAGQIADLGLYQHHKAYFDGIKSFNRDFDTWTPAP